MKEESTHDQFTHTPILLNNIEGLFGRLDIRTVNNFDPTVKDAISTASVRCVISIPKARAKPSDNGKQKGLSHPLLT